MAKTFRQLAVGDKVYLSNNYDIEEHTVVKIFNEGTGFKSMDKNDDVYAWFVPNDHLDEDVHTNVNKETGYPIFIVTTYAYRIKQIMSNTLRQQKQDLLDQIAFIDEKLKMYRDIL